MKNARILTVLSILIVTALFFAGCGSGSSDSTPTEEPVVEEVAAEAATEEVAADEPAAEDPAAAEAAATAEPIATEEALAEEAGVELAADPLIAVDSEVFVGDVIGQKNPALATISSLGTQIAWPTTIGRLWNKEGELCIYSYEDAANPCYVAPEIYEGYPYAFAWSPNDDYVAFTENPIQLGYESDIWMFNPVSNEFVNRTDDGVQGGWIEAEPGSYQLDYLPMWNLADDMLYFWRSEPISATVFTLELHRLAPEGGEPELVRDLSETFAGELLYFNAETWLMDGVSAISPDGTKLAMLVTSLEDPNENSRAGLWIIDLTDDAAPPEHLADLDALQVGQPAWSSFPLVPMGLSWSGDSAGVVVFTYNLDEQVPLAVLYYIEPESGSITPVVDFSDIPDGDAYMTEVNEVGLPPRFYSPWTASMSPNNDLVLMYQNIAGLAGILVSPIPPTGELPQLDYISQLFNTDAVTRSSRSADGKVLMYNIVFSTSEVE